MSDNKPIHVVAICGSLRKGNHIRTALSIALAAASTPDATTHLIDLNDYDLDYCDDPDNYGEGVHRLRDDVARAQGIILGTPVYHGGISGVLKNALDLMGSKQFKERVIGSVGVAGGSAGAILTLAALRNIGRSLHAWVIPHEVSIANSELVFTEDGQITDETIHERLVHLGKEVTRFAYMLHSEQTQKFVRLWETSAENPGITE